MMLVEAGVALRARSENVFMLVTAVDDEVVTCNWYWLDGETEPLLGDTYSLGSVLGMLAGGSFIVAELEDFL